MPFPASPVARKMLPPPAMLPITSDKLKARYDPTDDRVHTISQDNIDPNADKQNFVILMIGLHGHGKTTTFKQLFGNTWENVNISTKPKIDILRHHEVNDLVILDVPRNITSNQFNEKTIETEILKAAEIVGEPDIIVICRKFTYSQSSDYKKINDTSSFNACKIFPGEFLTCIHKLVRYS